MRIRTLDASEEQHCVCWFVPVVLHLCVDALPMSAISQRLTCKCDLGARGPVRKCWQQQRSNPHIAHLKRAFSLHVGRCSGSCALQLKHPCSCYLQVTLSQTVVASLPSAGATAGRRTHRRRTADGCARCGADTSDSHAILPSSLLRSGESCSGNVMSMVLKRVGYQCQLA